MYEATKERGVRYLRQEGAIAVAMVRALNLPTSGSPTPTPSYLFGSGSENFMLSMPWRATSFPFPSVSLRRDFHMSETIYFTLQGGVVWLVSCLA